MTDLQVKYQQYLLDKAKLEETQRANQAQEALKARSIASDEERNRLTKMADLSKYGTLYYDQDAAIYPNKTLGRIFKDAADWVSNWNPFSIKVRL